MMVLLAAFVFVVTFLDICNSIAVQRGFIYNNCVGNNRYTFPPLSGGSLYWDHQTAGLVNSSTYAGLMNATNIIDCVITFEGRPQGDNNGYEQFLSFFWRQWTFDTGAIARATQASLTAVDGLNQTIADITNVCGSTCPTGCMIMTSPRTGLNTTYCGADTLANTQFRYYYSETTIVWYFYLLGGYYESDENGTLTAIVNAPTMNIIIDYTSFFAGACYKSSQFQCPATGRCIDLDSYCDQYSAVNCGLPSGGDLQNCGSGGSAGYTALASFFPTWMIGVILGSILALLLICLWCFWRPGYLLWRCSRLRNLPCNSAACSLCCSNLCTHGCCSKIACCTLASASLAGAGCCAAGSCCCCGGGGAGGAGGGGGASGAGGGGGGGGGCGCCGNPDKDGDLSGNDGGFKADYHPGFEWTAWSHDDGMHLRELR